MTILSESLEPVRADCWREAMKSAVRDPGELLRLLDLPRHLEPAARLAAEQFGLFVPRAYLAKIRRGDPNDPLLRQVLPLAEETAQVAGFSADPVGDGQARLRPGLLQKYRGRVLMITTGACAVHCRYCFRRHYPYAEAPRGPAAWESSIRHIESDSSVHEVLLSGGDPLTIIDDHLAELAERLAAIGHVRRLRVHTRLPIVIPRRVNDQLLAWLTGTRLTPIVVVHANHPAELCADVSHALRRLADEGVMLLNQSVLLRGVNDSAEVLAELSERLVELRVMPYYLHQLDRVAGAAHFEVPPAEGRRIVQQLRARLPGYATPRYVQEVAGAESKVDI